MSAPDEADADGDPSTTQPAYWGEPTVNGGRCCRNLGEVRDNIDRLDREIIRLMAERGQYVHEAARFKRNPREVEAPARAEAVIQKARALAAEHGLAPAVAEAAYRAMVAAFIAYEQEVLAAAGTGAAWCVPHPSLRST